MTSQKFVSEPITPVVATCDTQAMATGAPGLPRKFLWRDRTLQVAAVLHSWRETRPCRHGSGQQYLRRHWYEVLTTEGATLKIYFDRQPPVGRGNPRWWLFSATGEE